MIVLNTPHSPEKLSAFWAAPETYWVCADGGADRLRQSLPEAQPQLIVGDLEVLEPFDDAAFALARATFVS